MSAKAKLKKKDRQRKHSQEIDRRRKERDALFRKFAPPSRPLKIPAIHREDGEEKATR